MFFFVELLGSEKHLVPPKLPPCLEQPGGIAVEDGVRRQVNDCVDGKHLEGYHTMHIYTM